MKAVIFNSGLGNRMGDFTRTHHKCQAVLKNGETILARQLRLLQEAGIDEVVITTGPFEEQLRATAAAFPALRITFVPNPDYASTNYIYSMHLARALLQDELLLMHGDLVFNRRLLQRLLALPGGGSAATVHFTRALPEKDFKARVQDGCLREVSIHIFDADCFAFQPLYRLSAADAQAWLDRVADFIARGENKCYAENALNELLPGMRIRAFSYAEDFIDEIDNLEDYDRVSQAIQAFDAQGL